MPGTLRAAGIASGIVLIAAGVLAFDYLQHGGRFKRLKPHFGGTCLTVPLAASAADLSIDHDRGIAYLSYSDRRRAGEPPARGTIALLDLNAPEPRPRAALATEPQAFSPGGISLYVPESGPRRLFAIDLSAAREPAVVIFEETATGAFAPVETIRDPLLTGAKGIAATGQRHFYVTHDSGATHRLQQLGERFFRRALSRVTYFDGERLRVVADGLRGADGVAVSNHGLWVYVSEGAGERLQVFDRDSETGALEPRNLVDLGSAPEHVTVDADGTVWVAAHPKLLALRAHLRDASKPSPTAVYRLRTSVTEKEDRLTIPFLDLGERLSAGSVAAVHDGRLLIGSRTEHRALLCKLPENL